MDGLVFATSSCRPLSPAAFSFSPTGHDQALHQFAPCEVLGQWWPGDVGLHAEPQDGAAWGDGGSSSVGNDVSWNSPAPAAKRRGRKPGPLRTDEPTISHVEAERQRRDKLHRLFCELRAAVPTVSRMVRASILADATAYIAELRARVEQLEARDAAARQAALPSAPAMTTAANSFSFSSLELENLEVRMVGPEAAALRLTTTVARQAPARLMDAFRSLDLPVRHAFICRLGSVTVQDAVVDVPAATLRDEGGLRTALLHRLQVSG